MAHILRDRLGTPIHDFGLNAALRNIAGTLHVHKFFSGALTSTRTSIGDVTSNTFYQWLDPSSYGAVRLNSTSVQDATGGTGIDRAHFFGITNSYDFRDEIVELDGQNDVYSANSDYIGIWRMHGEPLLTTSLNLNDIQEVGNIRAYIDGLTQPLAQITQGKGQTLMPQFIIPRGYFGLGYFGKVSVPAGRSVDGYFDWRETVITDSGTAVYGPARVLHQFNIYQQPYDYPFKVPLVMPERARIDVKAVLEGGADSRLSGGYDVLLFPNSWYSEIADFGVLPQED
jgi:hypothetical protein